VSHPSLLS